MIIKPFNAVFFLLLALGVALIVGLWLLARKRSERFKSILIVSICCANIVFFFVYKAFLSVDREFLEICGLTRFNWFAELPLQLCNINMFLIPLGILTKKRALLGFAFVVAPLGALMAILSPEPAFTGYSLLLPRMLGFYLTHLLILVCGISLAVLGFFRPRFRDLPKILITVVLLALGIHLVNLLLRATVCEGANYFFTCGAGGVGLLEMFWSWIPVPYLYELPAIAILAIYAALLCLGFRLAEKKKRPL